MQQPPFPNQQWQQQPMPPQQPPFPNQQYEQQQWQQQPMPPQQWNPQQPPYPPQQYQQPPQYQPLMPPPNKKSRKGLFIVLGVILVVALVACVGISALISAGGKVAQQTVNQASTQVAQLPTTQPTQSSTQAQTKIGVPFVVNDTWTVTVNKVSTNQGDNLINIPKAGNIYLIVNVTLKNTSSQNQGASSLGMFSLKDSTGQTYNQNIAFGHSPDGQVAAGGLVRGDIAYEVPKSIHSFTLQFVSSLASSDLTEWSLTI